MCNGNHPQMIPRHTILVMYGNLVIQTLTKDLHQVIKFGKKTPKGKLTVMGSKTTLLHKTVKTQFSGIKVIGTFNEKDECSKSPPIDILAKMHAQRPAQVIEKTIGMHGMCNGNHPQMVPKNTILVNVNLVSQTITRELHQNIKFR